MSETSSRERASVLIQGRYRQHIKDRSAKGLILSKTNNAHDDDHWEAPQMSGDDRWAEAMQEGAFREHGSNMKQGKIQTADARWKSSGFYATRLINHTASQTGEAPGAGTSEVEGHGGTNKNMEQAYWLELVDHKHRYGSSLKKYHKVWLDSDSTDNFFHWLDEGEGRSIDLPERSRARLDSEFIIYLSAEQRRNYLVRVDSKGKLRWQRNNEYVDTAKGKWKDLGNGKGIGPLDEGDNELDHACASSSDASSIYSTGSSMSDSSAQEPPSADIPQQDSDSKSEQGLATRIKGKLGMRPKSPTDKKASRKKNKNVWIFAGDMQDNMYVGMKQTGRFQHSSFLYGSKVRTAGQLKVKNGQLRSLSPLSGHYKSGTTQFKRFVQDLEAKNVDLSRISIHKSLMTIGGLEKYSATTKQAKGIKSKVKHVLHLDKKEEAIRKEKEEKELEEDQRLRRDDAPGQHPVAGAGTQRKSAEQREKVPHSDKEMRDLSYEERCEKGAAILRNVVYAV